MPILPKIILSLTICLLLASCSTVSIHTQQLPTINWAKRQAQLMRLNHWSNQGVVGMRTAESAWSATFNWQQAPTDYHLQLFAALGMGSLSLTGNPHLVELTTSKGEYYQAANAQRLLQQRTGWLLPVELLRYWIIGIPAPQLSSKLAFDTQHRLAKLYQQGWLVEYLSYQAVGQTELPAVIQLQNNYFKIRIVIKQWSLD